MGVPRAWRHARRSTSASITSRLRATAPRKSCRPRRATLVARRDGLLMLHWPDADAAGHAHGWPSPAYLRAARGIDHWLGELDALTNASRDPDTLLVVLADHGGGGTERRDHDTRPSVESDRFQSSWPVVPCSARDAAARFIADRRPANDPPRARCRDSGVVLGTGTPRSVRSPASPNAPGAQSHDPCRGELNDRRPPGPSRGGTRRGTPRDDCSLSPDASGAQDGVLVGGHALGWRSVSRCSLRWRHSGWMVPWGTARAARRCSWSRRTCSFSS